MTPMSKTLRDYSATCAVTIIAKCKARLLAQ